MVIITSLHCLWPNGGQARGSSLGASCEFWGNSPFLALDVTLIQHLPGRTHIAKSYWIYSYLKARDISHTMHYFDKNLQLLSKIKMCNTMSQLYNSSSDHEIFYFNFYCGSLGFREKKTLNPYSNLESIKKFNRISLSQIQVSITT